MGWSDQGHKTCEVYWNEEAFGLILKVVDVKGKERVRPLYKVQAGVEQNMDLKHVLREKIGDISMNHTDPFS